MKLILATGILFIATLLSGQEIADSVYWVYFTDKAGNGYQVDQPSSFLSKRSIDRRAWQGLGIDQRDLPVTNSYLEELKAMGVEIRHVSRWLNGIAMVHASDSLFQQVLQRSFTDSVAWEPDPENLYFPVLPGGRRFEPPLSEAPGYDYGVATEQVNLLRTGQLHQLGYTGNGVWIAVLDAGFTNVDSLPAFETLLGEGRLLGTRNYVNDIPLFRQQSTHGMYVLSTMAGEWDGAMVGTAPDASYLLCMTENPDQETRIEEIAWIEAVEYADSLGCDLLNTSLGYSDFDGTEYDYTYRDMNGRSTFISRAASLTASRGIISCNSAGNEGNDPWFYITAPADATDILTVGAVDSTNTIAGFSSRGPTFDSRVKPDVTAMGVASGLQGRDGGLVRGNGTSFSSPILAGSVASLWQAYPRLSAREIIRMVRQSGKNFYNPDSEYGFGTPDFLRAYWNINHTPAWADPGDLEIYPNPALRQIMVRIPEEGPGTHLLRLYDMSGRIVREMNVRLPGKVDLDENLRQGIYLLEIKTNRGLYHSRLVKE